MSVSAGHLYKINGNLLKASYAFSAFLGYFRKRIS